MEGGKMAITFIWVIVTLIFKREKYLPQHFKKILPQILCRYAWGGRPVLRATYCEIATCCEKN